MHEINLEKSSVFDQLFFKIELSSKKVLKLVPIKTSSIYCLKTNLKSDSKLVFRESRQLFLFFNNSGFSSLFDSSIQKMKVESWCAENKNFALLDYDQQCAF